VPSSRRPPGSWPDQSAFSQINGPDQELEGPFAKLMHDTNGSMIVRRGGKWTSERQLVLFVALFDRRDSVGMLHEEQRLGDGSAIVPEQGE
jgi:hypothetical protein